MQTKKIVAELNHSKLKERKIKVDGKLAIICTKLEF